MAERVNESQIKYILDYLTRNKNVSRVICVGPKSEDVFKIKWAQLAKELNSLGPPVKTVVQWQKVWRSLRTILKTIRNRSRMTMKKITSLISEKVFLFSEISGHDLEPTVEKKLFVMSNGSDIANFCLPVGGTVRRKEHLHIEDYERRFETECKLGPKCWHNIIPKVTNN